MYAITSSVKKALFATNCECASISASAAGPGSGYSLPSLGSWLNSIISNILSNKSDTLFWNAASPFAAATVKRFASLSAIMVAGFCSPFK